MGTGFFFAFIVAYLWNDIFIMVRSGEAGVLYRPVGPPKWEKLLDLDLEFDSGTVTDPLKIRREGLNIIAPWNTLYIYNTRIQQVPDSFTVLSSDGLEVEVQVSIRFEPQRDNLGRLHREIGPDYIEKIIKPEIQAQFRFVLGQYKPEAIYNSQGFIVQTVKQGALAQLDERFVLLDDLLLKAVKLPKSVADSIESKLRAQQLALEYDYRIEAEEKEAQRKRIEAEGIFEYKTKISENGIDDAFLRFRGIQATLDLAMSPNSKVIVIGGGRDGLPLILDGRTDGNALTTINQSSSSSDQQTDGNK